ncbi:hypothetical protein HELRODRAFT_188610 [Helobdella robusta]|uniref:G-patch domain-containing protein n=1 Tax=Helobdella robusta TaxID=6412 RepID=T1FQ65_HELRO|nr:hypothetical protein HELRODRAFT_188610 [Helobdella robusta]ESO02176.1 hypothetical protein HELRODRAFT_188610 [Helobdella robusta]
MAGKSDDEKDDFVTIGTPLPQYNEDEHISRKPIAVHEQVVRDAQGRIRFHGAFTGGFSAGYFNTVDTKEGWAPKTFKSSKFERSRQENVQKPEDFMDEEDFGEFGIAPKKLATKDKYKTCREEVRSQNQMTATEQADAFSLFTSSHLVHCLKPTRATIGMRLLRKLGWRHGRGVGTKAKRWKRMNKTSNPSSVAKLAYGCELPPELMMLHKKVNDDEDDDEDGDGNDDDQLSAEDICPINFTIKCDLHGLGYRGIDVNDALITKDRLREAAKRSDGVMRRMNKGIKGQAFGVGALEDEDEDVYSMDNPMIYDTSIPTSLEDDVHHAAAVDDDDGHGDFYVSNCRHFLETFSLLELPFKQELHATRHFSMPHQPELKYSA